MTKIYLLTSAFISVVLLLGGPAPADEWTFEYPCYLLDTYNADGDCWKGILPDGSHQYLVVPEVWLIGPPPSEESAVTMPPDHWVELAFRGSIVDGPGDDILLSEMGQAGEKALVFITDGAGQEYLLGLAMSSTAGGHAPTEIRFDISSIAPPFAPRAIRVVALDRGGASPGFDIANLQARISSSCDEIACNPQPVDGAKNVSPDTVLTWTPGCFADKHTVYLGKSRSDVGTHAIPVSDPAQPQDANVYDPCCLELGKTYYWRIDEVNDANASSPWLGSIWSFTVTDHLVLDDFEAYNDTNNIIYDTWIGIGGQFVDLSTDKTHPCGLQSMEFKYRYSDDRYSEAVRTFDPPQDWASAGVKAVQLFFYGEKNNYTNGQMYVSLSDGELKKTVPYDGAPADLKTESWQLWRIDLQDFTSLNLANVQGIGIGFRATTMGPAGSGAGTVYFDNVTLYASRCFDENRPDADFNSDCIVGYQDLEEMTHNWLDTGYNVYPVAAPGEPLVWYKFDYDTIDYSGNNHHGDPCFGPIYMPGVYRQAMSFDGTQQALQIRDAADLFSKIDTAITIAFWQYGFSTPHHTDTLCCSNYEYGKSNPAVAINLGLWSRPQGYSDPVQDFALTGRYNWDCGYPWSFDNRVSGTHRYRQEWTGRWNHWAFTKDANTAAMQIFLNAVLYDSRTDANSPIVGITSFEIGSGWYGRYNGLLDDFRIYNYALSQAEVAYVATNGTGVFDPAVGGLMSPADLDADNKIDFADFALLADTWLENQLWP
jgi:hypothetical protein